MHGDSLVWAEMDLLLLLLLGRDGGCAVGSCPTLPPAVLSHKVHHQDAVMGKARNGLSNFVYGQLTVTESNTKQTSINIQFNRKS